MPAADVLLLPPAAQLKLPPLPLPALLLSPLLPTPLLPLLAFVAPLLLVLLVRKPLLLLPPLLLPHPSPLGKLLLTATLLPPSPHT